jgi:hypothetical protein
MSEVGQDAFQELVKQVEILQEQVGELQADALGESRRTTASTGPPCEATGGLEGRALQQLEEGTGGHALQSVEGSEGKAVSPAQITPERLDIGDSYGLNASIWDGMLFFGHPALGLSVSLATLFSYVFNFVFQFTFCFMIWTYMLEPDVNSSTLDTLLKFRLSIAHNVEFADPITRQSLAQQLCNEDDKVHYAAGQLSLLKDVKTFMGGSGVQLMILAEILFLCVVVTELDRIAQFAKAVMSLGRSAETKLILVDGCENDVDDSAERINAEDLYQISVATRVEKISPLRVYFVWVCIIVPRLIICLFLAVTGVRFIGKTHSVDDLVLNCVAIAFVMDLDEVAFEGFVPRRLKTLINEMEPIPCKPLNYKASRRLMPVVWQITKIFMVLVSVIAFYSLVLVRFFWQLEQVDHILCSQGSTLDFVYARNSANNIIYVARSQNSDDWTPDEVTMMTVANLDIEPRFDWISGILDKQMELGISSDADSPAIVIGSTTTRVSDAEYDAGKYEAIVELGGMSLEQAASSIVCRDLGSSKEQRSYLAALQVLMKNTSIEACADVSWHYCTLREMTQLRALCPVRCNCHVPPTYELVGNKKALAGYFQSPQGGCPQSCQPQLETSNTIRFVQGNATGRCTDLEADDIVLKGSTRMKSSSQCFVNNTIDADCSELPPKAFWWLTFVAGLFEHLTADVAFPDIVNDTVTQSDSHFAVSSSTKPALVEWVSTGKMAQSFLDGSWDLMPGVPHPRGLRGCDYLTSFEVRSLLNTDLCSTEEYSSISFMCPVSCGCSLGQTYYVSDDSYQLDDGVLQASNRMEDLGSCPAECVMVHPDISEDTSWNSFICIGHDSCSAGEFCSYGICSPCDACYYCSDGVDYTCGSCGNGFPTFGTGPCLAPTLDCIDNPSGWHDSDYFGCDGYGQYQFCTTTGDYGAGWGSGWGTFAEYSNDGHDATTACCVCGGGLSD